jgi:hypothetical protein
VKHLLKLQPKLQVSLEPLTLMLLLPTITDLGTPQPTTGTPVDGLLTVGESTDPTQVPANGEVVLPETITGVNPLDVAPPVTGDVPVSPELPTGDVPTEITPPGEVEAPSLGNLPSDTSLDIAPPESLEASVPPIDNVPSPLEVAPPEGWMPEAEGEGVNPLDLNSDLKRCDTMWNDGNNDYSLGKCRAKALQDEADRIQQEIANLVGDKDEIGVDDLTVIALSLGFDLAPSQLKNLHEALNSLNNDPDRQLYIVTELLIAADGGRLDPLYLEGDLETLANADDITKMNYLEGIANKLSDGLYIHSYSPERFRNGAIATTALLGALAFAYAAPAVLPYATAAFARYAPTINHGATLLYDDIAGMPSIAGSMPITSGITRMTELFGDKLGAGARRLMTTLCGANSFSPDTKVATTAGLVTILSLKGQVNAEALAYNEATGEVGYYPITAFHENLDPVTINLTIDNDLTDDNPGLVLETTPEHPFYVNNTWVNAEDLTIGTVLTSLNENNEIIPLGTITATQRVEKEQVMYNLTVETANTFFVGESQWLVHNTNCPTKALIKQFENSFGIDSVHGLRRHGAGTTIEQQLWRAKTGYTPDGIQGSIRDATRFFDNDDLLEAYSLAVNSYRPGQPFVDIPFDRVVGEGYYAGGKVYGTSNVVRVQFNLEGKIVSGYPVLP